MEWINFLLLIPTYLVAREAALGWRSFLVLLGLTTVLMVAAKLSGLSTEDTISYASNLPGWKISFKLTLTFIVAVCVASALMIAARKWRDGKHDNLPGVVE